MKAENTTKETAAESLLTRRQVLRGAAGAGLLMLLPMLQQDAEAAPGQWVAVGKNAQFKTNQPHRVALAGGRVIFVTRISATKLIALSAKCTHQGCEVGWDKAAKVFLCPCHGSKFAAQGKALRGPAQRPLPSFTVTQKGGQVLVKT